MDKLINIGIVGGSGYTGLELIKILGHHKYSNISFVTSRSNDGKKIGEAYPSLKGSKYAGLGFISSPSDSDHKGIDLIFLCLPPHNSMEYIQKNMDQLKDAKIIDIGSDFRLKDPDSYKAWYGTEHLLPGLLKDFIYAMPEINGEEIKNSKNIANPGCYPTSVLLGLAPILAGGYKIKDVLIDSKSGVSGAGKKLKEMYLFGSLDNNFYAYSPSGHRHIGEMEQEIEKLAGYGLKIDFTPHLLPVSRGIFSSIYCKIENDAGEDTDSSINDIYNKFYSKSSFVKYMGNSVPQMKDTIGTNICMIGTGYDKRTSTLKIFSTLDNLLKGASGQAVQNMNLVMGLNEAEGLDLNGISV